jgi:hypothetical protein
MRKRHTHASFQLRACTPRMCPPSDALVGAVASVTQDVQGFQILHSLLMPCAAASPGLRGRPPARPQAACSMFGASACCARRDVHRACGALFMGRCNKHRRALERCSSMRYGRSARMLHPYSEKCRASSPQPAHPSRAGRACSATRHPRGLTGCRRCTLVTVPALAPRRLAKDASVIMMSNDLAGLKSLDLWHPVFHALSPRAGSRRRRPSS